MICTWQYTTTTIVIVRSKKKKKKKKAKEEPEEEELDVEQDNDSDTQDAINAVDEDDEPDNGEVAFAEQEGEPDWLKSDRDYRYDEVWCHTSHWCRVGDMSRHLIFSF